MTIYDHAKGYCCYDFSKFTHRSTELHDDRFLTDVTCDTGKNIHKTLISKFLYKKFITHCSVVQTRANDGNSTVFNETHISPPLRAVKHNLNILDTSHSTAQARGAYDLITSLHLPS